MKYTMPYYYNEFKCVADKCPDTCCAGWAIVIDKRTMSKYKKLSRKDRKYVMQHVDKNEEIFKQNGCRCSFLNDNNLCDLITKMGDGMLCKTCARYPRHFEEYGYLVEAALSMSCPIAAEMILSNNNNWKLKSRTDKKVSPHEKEIDVDLVTVLSASRDIIFEYIRNEENDFSMAIANVLNYGEELQKLLYKYQELAVDDDGDYKPSGEAGKAILAEISKLEINDYSMCSNKLDTSDYSVDSNKPDRQETFGNIMSMMLGMEQINDNWFDYIEKVQEHLYEEYSSEKYQELYAEFRACMAERLYERRNIFLYFIYTYFLGAVYDFNALGMIKFSVVSMLIIEELKFEAWLSNNKIITFDDSVKIAYRYSRQVEHSDNNLMAMEGLLTAHPVFETAKIIQLTF